MIRKFQGFSARIHINGAFNEDTVNPKLAFWNSIEKYHQPQVWTDNESFAEKGENYLRDRFGIYLKKRSLKFLNPNILRDRDYLSNEEKIRRRDEEIFGDYTFNVKIVSYGSINLDISISGLSELIEAFNKNYELFYLFLGAFIPLAFCDAIGIPENHMINVDIYNLGYIESEFKSANSKIQLVQTSTNEKSAKFFWLLANSTLLLPVLALIYIFTFELGSLKEEKVRVHNEHLQLLEKYDVLIDDYRERNEALISLRVEKECKLLPKLKNSK